MAISTRSLDRALKLIEACDAVVPHTDADGLAAGAIALRVRAESAEQAVLLTRGQTPFGDDAPLPQGTMAILDWGVRYVARPALIVDHHAPQAKPRRDQLVISGYGEKYVSTSVLMKRIVPDAPAWLVAVGVAGDYGDDGLRLAECADAPRTLVKKLVLLINAPRRLRDGPVRVALALLVEHDDPRAVLADPRMEQLEQARTEWRIAFTKAMRTAPAVNDRVALIRFSSPCQVHPLVATAWSQRLAPRVVIAANDGYLLGRVNFAVRGGDKNADLRKLLRDALPDLGGEYALGHDRATGGSITPDDFDRLVRALGIVPRKPKPASR